MMRRLKAARLILNNLMQTDSQKTIRPPIMMIALPATQTREVTHLAKLMKTMKSSPRLMQS